MEADRRLRRKALAQNSARVGFVIRVDQSVDDPTDQRGFVFADLDWTRTKTLLFMRRRGVARVFCRLFGMTHLSGDVSGSIAGKSAGRKRVA